MNKIVTLMGVAVAIFVLFQINSGKITIDKIVKLAPLEGIEVVTDERIILAEEEVNEKDDELKILAVGDIMLGRYVRVLMEKNGMNYPFEKLGDVRDIWGGDGLSDEDVSDGVRDEILFGNLEGPILGEGFSSYTSLVFGFNEDTAPYLKEKGFDILSVANNHALDQREEGEKRTVELLKENGIGVCGDSNEVNSELVVYGEVGDKTYAFVCFNDVNYRLNDEKALELVKEVADTVDYLVVSIHWGIEYQHAPNQGLQVERAHQFIDNGADLIIGHHPHMVQTFEVYNDRFIFYSLGNFIFDQYWTNDVQEELAIGVVMSENDDGIKTTVDLIPLRSDNSQVRLMNEDEKKSWLEKFIGYTNYSEEWKEMIKDGKLAW